MRPDPNELLAHARLVSDRFDVEKQLDRLEATATRTMVAHGAIERFREGGAAEWWKIPADAPPVATRARSLFFELVALRSQMSGAADGAIHHAIKVGAAAAVMAIAGMQGEGVTVTRASWIANVNKGTITRAANAGDILDNGKRGRARRLEPLSFVLWLIARDTDDTETAAEVEAKFS